MDMAAIKLQHQAGTRAGEGPFAPEDEAAYRRWRAWKLNGYPRSADDLIVEVRDPRAPTESEAREIRRVCRKTNMAIYSSRAAPAAGRDTPLMLGRRLGLTRLDRNLLADDDGVTALRADTDKARRGYIPYSNRRLLWHTDGYYNPAARTIRAFVLHCAAPAASGGETGLLDHELAYILLRDADPEFIRALMQDDALTIPANAEAAAGRAEVTGPVFAPDAAGNLHMRYTARTRSVRWKQDGTTPAAARFLDGMLAQGSPYIFHHRLAAGQGLICNNVLHNRAAYADDAEHGAARTMYRARYYDRIAGTDFTPTPSLPRKGGGGVGE